MDLRLGLRELRSEPSRLDIAGPRDSQLARIFPKPFRIVREGFSHLVARADVSRFTGAAARYERRQATTAPPNCECSRLLN